MGEVRASRDSAQRQRVEFEVHWTSYDNDDMPEDEGFPERDEGWYVDATLPDGTGFDLGPDHFGPGLTSIDHALVMVEKWARDRGGSVDREFGVEIKVVALVPALTDSRPAPQRADVCGESVDPPPEG